MRASFVKVNPEGNTTVLIYDPFPREIHPRIASQIMRPVSLAAEQVGFIERPTMPGAVARLQMMVGEFCGNACLGFAALLAERQYPGVHVQEMTKRLVIPVEVSGHDGVLAAVVSPHDPARKIYQVEAPMPVPLRIVWRSLDGCDRDCALVVFEGIVHAVVWDSSPSEKDFELIKGAVYGELGKVDCLGVMFYEEKTQLMTPLVYARDSESLVWESSCGSGTVAVASALAEKSRNSIETLKLSQPGGTLEVSVKWEEKVLEARISGLVTIEAEGVVYLSM